MDIPIGAAVHCLDGPGGHTSRVVVNPVLKKVTHLVVRAPGLLGAERMVPLSDVLESTSDTVHLRLTRVELADARAFHETEYRLVDGRVSSIFPGYPETALMLWPYVAASPPPDAGAYAGTQMVLPGSLLPEELAVRRGDAVEASDRHLGHVDEFLVNPVSGAITHLVLGEGHLWGKKEVTIPVSQIERIEAGAVHLKLSRAQVEALPSVHRR